MTDNNYNNIKKKENGEINNLKPKISKNYYEFIHKIFPYLSNKKYNDLLIDDDSFSYLSKAYDSREITNIIKKHIKKYKKNGDDITIVDATGNIGGDTIRFAQNFKNVYSIEFDKERYKYLKNNIGVYELNNVVELNGNSLNIIPKLKDIDIIYFDPPWGGKDYMKQDKLRLTMNNGIKDIYIEDIVINCFSNENSPNLVVLKLPKNYDINYLYKFMKQNNKYVKIYNMKKMIIVVIEEQK